MESGTVRVRVIADLVMPVEYLPSDHQQEVIASRDHNFLHSVGIDGILTEEEVKASAAHPHFTVHVHDASGQFCEGCALAAQDGLN
jgi:hypothetical protein